MFDEFDFTQVPFVSTSSVAPIEAGFKRMEKRANKKLKEHNKLVDKQEEKRRKLKEEKKLDKQQTKERKMFEKSLEEGKWRFIKELSFSVFFLYSLTDLFFSFLKSCMSFLPQY